MAAAAGGRRVSAARYSVNWANTSILVYTNAYGTNDPSHCELADSQMSDLAGLMRLRFNLNGKQSWLANATVTSNGAGGYDYTDTVREPLLLLLQLVSVFVIECMYMAINCEAFTVAYLSRCLVTRRATSHPSLHSAHRISPVAPFIIVAMWSRRTVARG